MKTNQPLSALFFVLVFLFAVACSTPPAPETADSPDDLANVTYRYDNLPDATDKSGSLAEFNAISKFDHLDITYFFINGSDKLPNNTEHDIVRQAFAVWAAQTPLTFTEVADRAQADIEIGWGTGEHGDGDAFDGSGGVLAHASFPNPFDNRRLFLHFDEAERWVNDPNRNVDLLTVAIHEIGHNLGLGHSNDPDSIMFASYNGPRRELGLDDVEGVQTLYGAGNVQPTPQPPPPQTTPQPSNQLDSDGDGLSDAEEVLQVGTNPASRDSDGDGIWDGVEVYYLMNPLDPDMDNDGINDGDEIVAGTNPLWPNNNSAVSPELSREVSQFVTNAIQLQIQAFRQGDASLAAGILAGDVFTSLENQINTLNNQGLVQISELDFYESYVRQVRLISNTQLEVDTCETWSTVVYRRSDGQAVSSDGPTLLPQTLTIQRLDSGWFITAVSFHDAPGFCG